MGSLVRVLASDLATQGYPQAEQARGILAQVREILERAKQVRICLTEAGDRCELKVSDDGCRFAPTLAATSGMGLRLMRYRAAMIGATVEAHSASAGG